VAPTRWLHKSDEIPEISKAMQHLGDNMPYIGPSFLALLTQVLRLYTAGSRLREISERLSKSVKTVSLQKPRQ